MNPILKTISIILAFSLSACAGDNQKQSKAKVEEPSKTTPAAMEPAMSKAAADFALPLVNGEGELKLSDYRGKVVILDFWATWCPPCIKEIPHFNELSKEYADKGLVVLGVSVDRDGVPAVEKFEKDRMSIDYPVAMFTQQVFDTYQAYLPPDQRGGIPFTFIIDKEGNIREKLVGYRPKEFFIDKVEPLL